MKTSGAPDRVVPMKVIVCGVQRTGTLSMRYALYQLGIHDCYHMHDVFENPSTDGPLWTRALKAKYAGGEPLLKEDWDLLLGSYQAVCDVPPAFFGPELAEIYPDAKVVILNRDPEKWYVSVLNSIHSKRTILDQLAVLFCLAFNPDTRAWMGFGLTMFKYGWPFDHRTEKKKAITWYKDIYKEFRERIPAERRIEFSVSEGWKPLCDFLELPIPKTRDPETGKLVEAPFPHLNDRFAFHADNAQTQAAWMKTAINNAWAFVGKAAVLGGVSLGGYLLWKSRLGGRF
ncbi:unnamed protein product [Clonostachys byssicola]|uniref:NAD dependent epimerase/dehydratase n=1 Tax=Clonostachys byssicola TaxID=160290 RepID=A0A9N9Y243_9HYPO|nr:unnamed protein product [Clonostachys byssicola]